MAPRKPRKPQAIDLLGEKISGWITKYSLQSDPYLNDLLRAIVAGERDGLALAKLAECDAQVQAQLQALGVAWADVTTPRAMSPAPSSFSLAKR